MTETPDVFVEASEGDLAEDLPVLDDSGVEVAETIEVGIETPEADAVEQVFPVQYDEDEYR
jgi:hypothetical protein